MDENINEMNDIHENINEINDINQTDDIKQMDENINEMNDIHENINEINDINQTDDIKQMDENINEIGGIDIADIENNSFWVGQMVEITKQGDYQGEHMKIVGFWFGQGRVVAAMMEGSDTFLQTEMKNSE
eukprot:226496_1